MKEANNTNLLPSLPLHQNQLYFCELSDINSFPLILPEGSHLKRIQDEGACLCPGL